MNHITCNTGGEWGVEVNQLRQQDSLIGDCSRRRRESPGPLTGLGVQAAKAWDVGR